MSHRWSSNLSALSSKFVQDPTASNQLHYLHSGLSLCHLLSGLFEEPPNWCFCYHHRPPTPIQHILKRVAKEILLKCKLNYVTFLLKTLLWFQVLPWGKYKILTLAQKAPRDLHTYSRPILTSHTSFSRLRCSLLTLFQPHFVHCHSCKTQVMLPTQDSCTCYSFCL